MAELKQMSCQGCGKIVEYYDGQGLFKCGSCGSIFESLGEGAGGIKPVQITGSTTPTSQQQPYPGSQASFGGWQQPPTAGDAATYQQPQAGYQHTAGQPGFQAGYQQTTAQYQPIPTQPLRAPGSGKAAEFLTFRRFVTPVIIQILFWIGVLFCVVSGILVMTAGSDSYYGSGPSGWQVLVGFIIIILGPLWVRIWCELLILLFRIYDELKQVNYNAWYTSYNTSQLLEADKKSAKEG